MLVHVSQPHMPDIVFTISGNILADLLADFRNRYGKKNIAEENDTINARDIDWAKDFGLDVTLGEMLRMRRVDFEQWTQREFAEKLDIPWQYVSNMERVYRPISIAMARRLGRVFGCSPELFIA